MGFFAHSIKEPITWQTNNTKMPINAIPIFLFPGIFGVGNLEFSTLVKTLQKQYPDRNIYVYNDPAFSKMPVSADGGIRVTNGPENSGDKMEEISEPDNLEEYAASIIKEMKDCLALGQVVPFVLAGYSFGGALAAKIGALLQKQGCDIRLFIIDAPTPVATQAYFKTQLPVNDLIAIMEYAGNLSGFSLSHDELSITELATMELDDCIDMIAKALKIRQMIGGNEKAQQKSLKYLTYLAKRNLKYLLEDTELGLNLEPSEAKLTCLITHELSSKYDGMAGWAQYSPQLIAEDNLLSLPHTELMTEDCHSLALAFRPTLAITTMHIASNFLESLFHLDLSEQEKLTLVKRYMSKQSPSTTPPLSNTGQESGNDSEEEKSVDHSISDTEHESGSDSEEEKHSKVSTPEDSDDEKIEVQDKQTKLYGRLFDTSKRKHPDRTTALSCPNLSKWAVAARSGRSN